MGDYHTHTKYSDGYTTCRENVEAALKIGLKEIAITDHGFNNPSRFALTRNKYIKQRAEINLLRVEYGSQINILHGVETDIIGCDGTIDANESDIENMDILILGYHSFAKAQSLNDWRKLYLNSFLSWLIKPSEAVIRRNTKALISAIQRYPIDILAHINHLLKVDCYEIAKAASDYGTLIELNEKHINFDGDVFDKMLSTTAKFIINSDGHRVERVGVFPNVVSFINKHNIPANRIVNLGQIPVFMKNKNIGQKS